MNYIICATNTTEPSGKFLAIDYNSGGYFYWSKQIDNAKFFHDIEEAKSVCKSILKSKNGKISTPLYSAANLCNSNVKSNVIISIRQILLFSVYIESKDVTIEDYT